MKKILFLLLFIPFIVKGQDFVLNPYTYNQCDTILTPVNDTSTLYSKSIAWYDFDETSGNLLDKTDNNLDGVNDASTVLYYNSLDQYLYDTGAGTEVSDNNLLTPSGAWSMWVKAKSPANNTLAIALWKYREYRIGWDGTWELMLYDNGTDALGWYNSTAQSISTDYSVLANMDGTGNTGNIDMYVNNSLDTPSSTGGNVATMTNTANDLWIGSSYASNFGFNSTIQQIVIFSDTLNASERAALYNSDTKLYYEDLITTSYDTTYVNCPEPTPDPPVDIVIGNYLASADYFVNDTGTGDTLTYAQLQDSVSTGVWGVGNTIALKAGLSYEGALDINCSGSASGDFVIGAYGTGTMPIIYGSEEVTGTWSVYSGNIYSISHTGTVNQVFEDGVELKAARYPNTGYADLTSVASSSNITASSLPNIDHTGSVTYLRTAPWALEARSVTNSTNTNTTLTLSSDVNYGATGTAYLRAGTGIFLTNNLEYIDEAGEWYHDGTTLYVWTPDGTSPSDNTVRASTIDNIIDITNQSYVTLTYLDIQHANRHGIYADNCDYINIDSLTFSDNELMGINVLDNTSSNFTITECNISNSHLFGARVYGDNHLIQDNVVENIGLFADVGIGGVYSDMDAGQIGTGIFMRRGPGGNNIVRYNTVENVGYNGIWYYWNPNILVEYNYIKDVCLVLDDGGGIYSFGDRYNPGVEDSDGGIIRYNIIDGVLGTTNGFWGTRRQGNGVYFDQYIRETDMYNNVIANVTEGGIKQHDNDNVASRNNILFNCGMALDPLNNGTGNHMKSNTVLNRADVEPRTVGTPGYLALVNSGQEAATAIDSNYYYDFHRELVFKQADSPYTARAFAQWQTFISDDANSTFDGTALGAGEIEILFYNTTKTTEAQDLSGYTWRDLDGSPVTSLTLQPFTGEILIRE